MKAIAVRRGEETPEIIEKPRPGPAAGEALVRTLRVGVDGTDHEVIAGSHGGYPKGEDHIVLGHEAVGVVVDPNGTGLSEGDVVVPTVRRRPNGSNDYFARGEPDMAPEGQYHERGIDGAHGFMAEYFTSPAEHLVHCPPELSDLGFLVEPASITEKAIEHARASRSAFEWDPKSAFVLGNGSLGLLTVAMLRESFDRLYCLGRRDRPDPTIDIIDELNVSRETASWLVERSGATPAGADTGDASPNGPSGPQDIHVDWSAVGRDSTRLTHVGRAMADLLAKEGEAVDLTIGIEKAGTPLATTIARELDTDLAAYAPAKHQWDEGDIDDVGGGFSRNFATIRGRECFIVDDTVTSGTTLTETVEAVHGGGGQPKARGGFLRKKGPDEGAGVPVYLVINGGGGRRD